MADFAFPFRALDRLGPADTESADTVNTLDLYANCLTVLAHHTGTLRQAPPSPAAPGLFDLPGGGLVTVLETAAVFFDSRAVFDMPGTADLVAVHLLHTPSAKTFRLRAERVPTLAIAQRWLAEQGLAPTTLTPAAGTVRATDSASRAAEQRIRADRAGRFEVVDHFTHEDGPVYVLYRDHQPGALPPYLAQAEVPDTSDAPLDYRVREARFATADEADTWHRDGFPPNTPAAVRPATNSATRPASGAPRRPRRR
ncbi:hypothetical protein [Streptacidiphilus jiangxiensis]|uniref:Uncharacterized protein n=1 Tax=Streptacidiphilus jiangxiensis TaxID=235985 RepID=A0A1H8A7B8_STRJI|nr:hypothetical protein [Streptacidiphilus jiangxiensis]SEM65689.1 hypothetical protein SAMN05414137_14111 [Streptacidiphilus jiangxiensis]